MRSPWHQTAEETLSRRPIVEGALGSSRFSVSSQAAPVASRTNPGSAHEPTLPVKKDFWQRWYTRVVVIVAAVLAVLACAVFGDPAHESWHTKTWELVQNLITKPAPGTSAH
jgi:hypothetical protein